VSRIEFDSSGTIIAASRILNGSNLNCAGGATPWGTWLSGEEASRGTVWECDPTGVNAALARPAMGLFTHEAVAVHPASQSLYLTEDRTDGALYRFRPTSYPSLSSGVLEVLTESGLTLSWQTVPDPSAATTATRNQVAGTKRFNGGEGICHHDGSIYFTTKGDNRVWRYTPATNSLSVVYDPLTATSSALTGVDNITVLPTGDLYVAEDGGDMQVVMLAGSLVQPVLQINIAGSELTGVCFDPSMTRMYVSSQRNPGTTFEITGPWRSA
jgi:secreted PhoX family phosphatase